MVQAQIVGERLAARLTPALAHLATTVQTPIALTIYLCESATSGVAMPPMPFQVEKQCGQEDRSGYFVDDERFRIFYQPAAQTLCLLDDRRHCAYYWIDDARHLPLSQGGAPLLTLLHWWFGKHGGQVVHGAAIGTAAGGALLVGKSGSGKSTTALAGLAAGLFYVADDYCLVRHGAEPMVHSLYSSGKLHFADLLRFPRLQSARTGTAYTQADKALFFFAEDFADQIVPALPLKALLLPVITENRQTRWHEISPSAALLALAPSTVLQLVGDKQQTMQQLSQLVRQLPCYRLALGREIQAIPAAIAELLATLRN